VRKDRERELLKNYKEGRKLVNDNFLVMKVIVFNVNGFYLTIRVLF
jgi:hypothetical protein